MPSSLSRRAGHLPVSTHVLVHTIMNVVATTPPQQPVILVVLPVPLNVARSTSLAVGGDAVRPHVDVIGCRSAASCDVTANRADAGFSQRPARCSDAVLSVRRERYDVTSVSGAVIGNGEDERSVLGVAAVRRLVVSRLVRPIVGSFRIHSGVYVGGGRLGRPLTVASPANQPHDAHEYQQRQHQHGAQRHAEYQLHRDVITQPLSPTDVHAHISRCDVIG